VVNFAAYYDVQAIRSAFSILASVLFGAFSIVQRKS